MVQNINMQRKGGVKIYGIANLGEMTTYQIFMFSLLKKSIDS